MRLRLSLLWLRPTLLLPPTSCQHAAALLRRTLLLHPVAAPHKGTPPLMHTASQQQERAERTDRGLCHRPGLHRLHWLLPALLLL
jgi:hypothetical protein